jgi:hypothetical protein
MGEFHVQITWFSCGVFIKMVIKIGFHLKAKCFPCAVYIETAVLYMSILCKFHVGLTESSLKWLIELDVSK